MAPLYEELKKRTRQLWQQQNLLEERINIRARPLDTEEAIGNPEAHDFPLQKGNEKLMQAEFGNALGQAFTDRYGNFEGSLEEILQMGLENNFRRAIFVAALNATLRHLNLIDRTVHCRDQEPTLCAEQLGQFIDTRYRSPKIVQIGYQPRMIESLSHRFPLRVIDLDPDNIGTLKYKVTIQGPEAADAAIHWADLLLVTGTTLVNGTIGQFLNQKPALFYGTTIAGAAYLMGWERFCGQSQ